MAKLHYPSIIQKSQKFTALADLGTQLNNQPIEQIMTTLVDLLGDEFVEILAEKWSVTGDDGLFLADSDGSK